MRLAYAGVQAVRGSCTKWRSGIGFNQRRNGIIIQADSYSEEEMVAPEHSQFSNTNRAVFILMKLVLKAVILVCGDVAMETAKFLDMADKMFDTLNVHN